MNMIHQLRGLEMSHEDILRAELSVLRAAHRDLDREIAGLTEQRMISALTLQRMKKQKLLLKDQIARLEDEVIPDIIA